MEFGEPQGGETEASENWEIVAGDLEEAAAKLFALQHFS
jgi:hypothetical protein